MNIEMVVFGVTFVVALGSALAMLFARNAVHAALFLVAVQLALAVAFLLQGAYFIAAIQVIVYAGAIMVLFLFVIMLLGVDRREVLIESLPAQRGLAVGLGALLTAEIIYIAFKGIAIVGDSNAPALEALNEDPGNVEALARALFSRYLLPFEVTSVLLVVAVVGAMVLTRRIAAPAPPTHPVAALQGDQAPDSGTGRPQREEVPA